MYIDFNDKDFTFKGDGVMATMPKGTATNLDYAIAESGLHINGAEFIYQNSVWGDWVECQIIDIDNVLGYGVNTVLSQYLAKWYLDPSTTRFRLESPYAGALPNGTYVRIVYHSVGTVTDPKVLVNYFMHDEKST